MRRWPPVRLALRARHPLPGLKACLGVRVIAVRADRIATGGMIAIVRAATVVLPLIAMVVRRGRPRARNQLTVRRLVRRRAVRHGAAMATGVTRAAEIGATTGHGAIAIATTSAGPR